MTLKSLWPVTQQFQAKNGSNLVSGKVYIYYQGRTALATTYHDEEGKVVNSNPVLLDNNGRATVFADTAYSYTIVVCDYYGKELFSQDITLHDAISIVEDVIVIGSNDTVKVDTTTLTNGVQYDLSVNTDIIATKESVEDLESSLLSKQDVLTPGSNIAITNNIISATGIPTKTSELVNDSEFISSSHKNKWYDITSYLGSMSSINITDGRTSFYFNPFLLITRFEMWFDCNSTSSINVFNFFDDIPSNYTLGFRDTIGRTNTGYACIARIHPSTGVFAKYVNVSANSNFIKADTFNSFGCPDYTIYDYLASKGFIED